jgi:TonB family protein
VTRFLSLEEERAFTRGEKPAAKAPRLTEDVAVPAFDVPLALPPGLGARLLADARCNESWLGVVSASADRAGRVQSVDTSRVFSNAKCRRALETMLRLSFATPSAINAPLTTSELQVVHGEGVVCFDDTAPDQSTSELLYVSREVKPPKVIRRVEPSFPEAARRAMPGKSALVISKVVITKTGCVRSVQILAQALTPELNSAAVLALSKWKFEPATLDGQPIDVIYALVVNFKLVD